MTARMLIGYECSGAMRRAFRAAGVDAWSCDLLPSTDGSRFHIQCDVRTLLHDGWDAAIFHPECTYLTCSAEWAYADPDFDRYPGVGYHQRVKSETLVGADRRAARDAAVAEVRTLLAAPIPLTAVENPRGVLSARLRPADQTIQPYWFGDDASKATCLWLKGLPKLIRYETARCPGRIVEWPRGSGKSVERWSNQSDGGQNRLPPSPDRASLRSATYQGFANAAAFQWSRLMDVRAAA